MKPLTTPARGLSACSRASRQACSKAACWAANSLAASAAASSLPERARSPPPPPAQGSASVRLDQEEDARDRRPPAPPRSAARRRAGTARRTRARGRSPCAMRAITASARPGGSAGSGSPRSSDTVSRSSRSSRSQVAAAREVRADQRALVGGPDPVRGTRSGGRGSPSASRLDSFRFLVHERAQPLAQGIAGAVDARLDRALRHLEHARDLAVGQALDVEQHDGEPQIGRAAPAAPPARAPAPRRPTAASPGSRGDGGRSIPPLWRSASSRSRARLRPSVRRRLSAALAATR